MESKCKTVTKLSWKKWSDDLRNEFDFVFHEEKVVHAKCKCCQRNVSKIKSMYKGKLVDDVVTYGVEGTSWITKFNLERHISSSGHLKCKGLETGTPVGLAPDQRQIEFYAKSARKNAIEAIRPLIRIALHVGRKELPLSAFAELVDLHVDNGCKISKSYRNRKGCKTLLNGITTELAGSLKVKVRNECSFFSWLTDGSTVKKRKLTYESELVYIRTAPGLQPITEQLDLLSMREYVSVNAANLYHATLRSITSLFSDIATTIDTPVSVLEETLLPHIPKLIGAGADGAAVNFGSNTGLLTRWTKICDWLVKVHCFSHRLELAAKDALEPTYGHVDDFLQKMYYHFRNSPKEWSSVGSIAEKLNLQVLTMPKCFGTRFVSHRRDGVKALRNNWVCLILHFSNSQSNNEDDNAAGYLSQYLLNFKFYLECHQYVDILSIISLASNAIQGEHADLRSIVDACNQINLLELKLGSTMSRGGCFEDDAVERLRMGSDADPSETLQRSTRQNPATSLRKIALFCKRIIQGNRTIECDFEDGMTFSNAGEGTVVISQEKRSSAMLTLKECLKARFDGIRCNSVVLNRLKWLNHKSWIDLHPEQQDEHSVKRLSEFGNEDVSFLFLHFKEPLSSAGCDSKPELLEEFSNFKFLCQTIDLRQLSTSEFWPAMYKKYGDKFKRLFLLVELILCIPFSNAVVERGFSAVRRIMTDWRVSLSHETIRDLMLISTRKAELEDCATRERLVQHAAENFVHSDKRRRFDVPEVETSKQAPPTKISKVVSPAVVVIDNDISEV